LVQNAVRHAAAARREATTTSVDHLFTLLGLRPRIPPPLLADVVTAFVDGLIISATLHPDQNVRAAFDVFWLSMLGLSE
jgi:hypothetical protein